MTFNEYFSTQDEAPALNTTAGSMLAVLAYALTAEGWVRTDLTATSAVFSNATGTANLCVKDALTEARVYGVNTSNSDVQSYPSSAQSSGGFYFPKSTASGFTRPWVIHANPTSFYFTVDPNAAVLLRRQDAGSARARTCFFGEIGPNVSALIADSGGGSASGVVNDLGIIIGNFSTTRARLSRSSDGTVLSDTVGVSSRSYPSTSGNSNIVFPSANSGGLSLTSVDIFDSKGDRAGRLPGFYGIAENRPLTGLTKIKKGNRAFRLLDNLGLSARFALEINPL